jgi:phosphoglycolate/pyridoxal phosphate phosphatase family enzyme
LLRKGDLNILTVRTFVFDLDGVIYRGSQPLPSVIDTISSLRQLGHQVYFFTNNATQTRNTYVCRLSSMGIPVDEEHIMTSAYATAMYLKSKNKLGKNVYVVGEDGLRAELEQVGMKLVDGSSPKKVDFVIVGLDREFTYNKLMLAQQAIYFGAEFIATNRDTTYPLENGKVVPGGGSIVSAIEAATDTVPLLIGKPEVPAMLEVFDIAGADPSDVVVVGDRLDTDILAGKRAGALTVLVLTGITTPELLADSPDCMKPDITVNYLSDMLDIDVVMTGCSQ